MPATKSPTYRDRVLELLASGPKLTTDLYQSLGVPAHKRGGVFGTLEKLRKDGIVTKEFKRITPAGTNKGWGQKERVIAVWALKR